MRYFHFGFVFLFIFQGWLSVLRAQTELEKGVEKLEDAPPLAKSVVVDGKVEDSLSDDVSEAQLLEVFLRADMSFSAGKPVEQGFSVPSLRFGARGDLARFMDYSFAMGPTREYSSMLLPQLLPVEAWLRLRDSGKNSWKSDTVLAWKLGMFIPSLNPMWSRDLSDLPIPDYSQVHQDIFMFRDIGTELSFSPVPGSLDMVFGVFNGSGIVNLNTNNTRAFNVVLKGKMPLGKSELSSGIGGYYRSQAERGGVNYLSNWVANWFASWQMEDESILVFFDISSGRLEDSTRNVSVFGSTGLVWISINHWLKVFGRAELLRYSPTTAPSYNHYQIGPAFELMKRVHAFLFYDQLDQDNGQTVSSGQALVRINI